MRGGEKTEEEESREGTGREESLRWDEKTRRAEGRGGKEEG